MRQEALNRGYSPALVNDALPADMQPLNKVLMLDRRQPGTTKDIDGYLKNIVTDARVTNGLAKMHEQHQLLDSVSKVYTPPPEVIAAVWGLESGFGANTGKYKVTQSLATLAYGGATDKRRSMFRQYLFDALKILDQEKIPADSLRGSWAGAMGQVQFMPGSFFSYAVDFDKNGKRDIWRSLPDIFASAANHLEKVGWDRGEGWGYRVDLPNKFSGQIGRDKDGKALEKLSVDAWNKKGVRLKNGAQIPAADASKTAYIIQPDGPGTSAFIVFDNFDAIRRWNKSDYFAVSVGLMSDKLKAAKL